jgi:hypothetical protein
MAMGTAPRLSGDSTSSSWVLLDELKILTDTISSNMPPAISKLKMDNPKMVRISWPKNAKIKSKITHTNIATL